MDQAAVVAHQRRARDATKNEIRPVAFSGCNGPRWGLGLFRPTFRSPRKNYLCDVAMKARVGILFIPDQGKTPAGLRKILHASSRKAAVAAGATPGKPQSRLEDEAPFALWMWTHVCPDCDRPAQYGDNPVWDKCCKAGANSGCIRHDKDCDGRVQWYRANIIKNWPNVHES